MSNGFNKLFSKQKNICVFPFFVLGYPTLEISKEIIKAAAETPACGLMLAIPFNNPLTSQPERQNMHITALEAGADLRSCLRMIKEVRKEINKPIALLTYFNLLYRYGIEETTELFTDSGIDALFIVDLPPEEAEGYEPIFKKNNIGWITSLALNTKQERAKELIKHQTAFVYLNSDGKTDIDTAFLQHLEQFEALSDDAAFVVNAKISSEEDANDLNKLGIRGIIPVEKSLSLVNNISSNPEEILNKLKKELTTLSEWCAKASH